MPGGSGLLWKLCERFDEIVAEALRVAAECPDQCARSCIDCLQRYRNAFYHEHLNRQLILERLEEWGNQLEPEHEIAPKLPMADPTADGQPVNQAEEKLRRMLAAADLPDGRWQERRSLSRPLDSTTPDVTYDDPDDDERRIYIYLDGLSAHIHGNPETRDRDRQIRAELRSQDHEVLEISAVDLDDHKIMVRHFKRLARQLIGRDGVDRVTGEADRWFAAREGADTAEDALDTEVIELPFVRIETPTADEMFQTCVPIYSLKAAAGGFSEGQVPEPEGWAAFESIRSFSEEMFIGQVVGCSMAPKIPDGAWCLFSREIGGSKWGRIVLVQLRDAADPETGGRYTVKRYERDSQPVAEGGELGGIVRLKPLNLDFEEIVVEAGEEGLAVIAEVVEVLG